MLLKIPFFEIRETALLRMYAQKNIYPESRRSEEFWIFLTFKSRLSDCRRVEMTLRRRNKGSGVWERLIFSSSSSSFFFFSFFFFPSPPCGVLLLFFMFLKNRNKIILLQSTDSLLFCAGMKGSLKINAEIHEMGY